VKRRNKMRNISHYEDITQKTMHLWDVVRINYEEFAKEVVDVLWEFSSANKWSVSKISS
jgi:hypothetical protein